MIRTFRHRGLEAFYRTGAKGGIQPHHAGRLRVLLTALDCAKGPQDMNAPAWRMHPLHGDMSEHYAVTVDGNWRMTFAFEDGDAVLVDYLDYH